MSTKPATPRLNPTRTRDYLGTRALGFSLVELIVGMSIAVLCIGVIYQTMANSSRTVSFAAGATDADTSAKMTLYMLEEQINRAGFGLTGFGSTATDRYGCTITNNTDTALPTIFAPASITSSPSNDTLHLMASGIDYPFSRQFEGIAPLATPWPTGQILVSNNYGITTGDLLLLISYLGTDCGKLYQVRSVSAHTTVPAGSPGLDTVTLNNAVSFNGRYYHMGSTAKTGELGQQPISTTWQVDKDGLYVTNHTKTGTPATPTEIYRDRNTVGFKVEYGVDTDADTTVDAWQNGSTTPTWANVVAIRVGLLVRNSNYEKTADSTTYSWAGGNFTMQHLDGTDGSGNHVDPTKDWKHYRYRTYQRIYLLRNVVLGQD